MTETAIVIHPKIKARKLENSTTRSDKGKLEEAVSLATSAALNVINAQIVNINKITPSTYIGKGKVTEVADFVQENKIAVAIINTEITPVQQRNLEKSLQCKVIDRTALILEIFGQRAKTKEGILQVALAAQEYQKSRLVRSWTHLERQRGGAGFMGGPGETQIETDRRAIRDRIAVIKKQLEKVVKTREEHRKARQKVPYKIVSLVGYTNAGKSTLFNKITGASVIAEDKLFATLDPTMRLIKLPSGTKIILSDTVGFISDLPTELIAAFRATLEEVVEADIIIHVRDISSHESNEQKKDVMAVLSNLGLEQRISHNMLEILNKIDTLSRSELEQEKQNGNRILTSAITGDGIKELLQEIDKMIACENKILDVTLNTSEGKFIAWLYANGKVLSSTKESDKITLKVSLSEKNFGVFKKKIEGEK